MIFLRSKNAKALTLIAAVLVVVVILYANLLSRKEAENKKEIITTPSVVEQILNKDYKNNYPASVREVVRTYFKVIENLYNEDLSEDDFIDLADVERLMMDDVLLEENSYSDFMTRLKSEVKDCKDSKTRIGSWEVEKNNQIQYWYHDNYRYASIKATVQLIGQNTQRVDEKFILKENKDGRWKIIGWVNADEEESNEGEE